MRISFLLALLLCFSIFTTTKAHGRLTKPTSRDAANGVAEYLQNAPVSGLTGSDFVCRNQPAASPIQVKAGQSLAIEWTFSAAHVGDCSLYVSYDTTASAADMQWFKLTNFLADENPPRDCRLGTGQTYSFPIPSWLPNGNAVFRWEWYALHVRSAGRIEYYAQCFDGVVSGGADISTLSAISPKVKIGSHLPSAVSAYRDAFSPSCDQDLRTCTKGDGVAVGNNFMVGAKVATSPSNPSASAIRTLTPTPKASPASSVIICTYTWLDSSCTNSVHFSSHCFAYSGSCKNVDTTQIGQPSSWNQIGSDLQSNPPFQGFETCTTVNGSLSYKWICGYNPDDVGISNKSSQSSGKKSGFGSGFATGFFITLLLVGGVMGGGVWLARKRREEGRAIPVPAWTGLGAPGPNTGFVLAPAVPDRKKPRV